MAIASWPCLALVLALGLARPLGAQGVAEAGLPQSLAALLERTHLPAGAVGVYVAEAQTGTVLFGLNADEALNPASTMKLLTTYAALSLLGPAYTYRTQAWITGSLEGGVLEGDLILHGSGDPHFTEADLWSLLHAVSLAGVQTVHGNIVLDRSVFAPSDRDPGQFDNEPYRPYNVSPDGFLVNFNATALVFSADPSEKRVAVRADPPLFLAITPPRLSDEPCGADWRERLGADFTGGERLAFTGSFSLRCGEKSFNASVFSARDFSARLVMNLWRAQGARLEGQIVEGVLPAGARLVAEHESAPLAVELYDMNKFSNNVMARSIYLTLAAEAARGPATASQAEVVLRRVLAEHGIATGTIELDNGSGLSRRERISARALGGVLLAAWRSPNMPEFIATLPKVGEDGTMRTRLRSEEVAGHAHIKTGSLADVQAIAGFVDARSGRRLVVVCLVNDAQAERARPFQDALIAWLYDNG